MPSLCSSTTDRAGSHLSLALSRVVSQATGIVYERVIFFRADVLLTRDLILASLPPSPSRIYVSGTTRPPLTERDRAIKPTQTTGDFHHVLSTRAQLRLFAALPTLLQRTKEAHAMHSILWRTLTAGAAMADIRAELGVPAELTVKTDGFVQGWDESVYRQLYTPHPPRMSAYSSRPAWLLLTYCTHTHTPSSTLCTVRTVQSSLRLMEVFCTCGQIHRAVALQGLRLLPKVRYGGRGLERTAAREGAARVQGRGTGADGWQKGQVESPGQAWGRKENDEDSTRRGLQGQTRC